ncbi:iron-sulfur cluster-binding domain-containing protein [Rothia sp. ZJ1223]|uniref:flavin reductase family protein n=1 Tax=Rothia sp. ZJ1223 TaxID=2811098 RepID=UPI00195DB75A|nr:iron-sulfur cluster-binding domain-containing protein [Rothia sp. ZJ1223]
MKRKNILSRMSYAALGLITHPQDPREFIQVFNPLSSSHYTRGVVTEVHHETPDSATITFTAGEGWASHKAGQWARIGVSVNGRRLWRPYSISAAEDTAPSVTVKARGRVSEALVYGTKPGDILYLERPAGQFLLEISPTALLFLTAGSGITPVMSMLRTLMPRRPDHDVVLIHSSANQESTIFHDEILELADQFPGFKPRFHFTKSLGRLTLREAGQLAALYPDVLERTIYACGPDEFVGDIEAAVQEADGNIVVERFDTRLLPSDYSGPGTLVINNGTEITVPENQSILEASENAGTELPHGCRSGVCRSCLVMMSDGAVKNMRTGEMIDEPGMIQSCISRPSPHAILEL